MKYVTSAALALLVFTGATARPLPDPLIGEHLHELMATRSFIFLGGHGASSISRDGGNTFATVAGLDGIDAMELSYVPVSNLVAVAGHDGIRISHDGGHTWQPVVGLPTPDIHAFGIAQDSPNHFVAYDVGHGLFASTDAGKTWQSLGSLEPITRKMHPMMMPGGMQMAPQPMGDIAVLPELTVVPMMPAGMAISRDGGATWSLSQPAISGMLLHAGSPQWVLSGMGVTYRSDDRGATWQEIPEHPGTPLQVMGDDGYWYAARAIRGHAALWKSADARTWKPLTRYALTTTPG